MPQRTRPSTNAPAQEASKAPADPLTDPLLAELPCGPPQALAVTSDDIYQTVTVLHTYCSMAQPPAPLTRALPHVIEKVAVDMGLWDIEERLGRMSPMALARERVRVLEEFRSYLKMAPPGLDPYLDDMLERVDIGLAELYQKMANLHQARGRQIQDQKAIDAIQDALMSADAPR